MAKEPKGMLTAGLGSEVYLADFLMATKHSDNFKAILVTERKIRSSHIHEAPEHLKLKGRQVHSIHMVSSSTTTAVQHFWGNTAAVKSPAATHVRQERHLAMAPGHNIQPSRKVPWAHGQNMYLLLCLFQKAQPGCTQWNMLRLFSDRF